jgi:hypothetical protein
MDNKRIRRLVKLPRDRFKKISGAYLEERPNKRMTSDEFLEQVIGQLAELGVSREAGMRHDDFIRTAWAVGHSSHSVALDIAKKEHRAARHEAGRNPRIRKPSRRAPKRKAPKKRRRKASAGSERSLSPTLAERMRRALGVR